MIHAPPLVEPDACGCEFVREPEALFWTFLFPIIMSVAMAIAFPASGGQTVRVGVSPGTETAALRQCSPAPGTSSCGRFRLMTSLALRDGEVHLIVAIGQPADLSLRSDAGREPARTARRRRGAETAAGRTEPWQATEDLIEIPGSRTSIG